MPKFTGTIRHNDLEGGFHELHTDDGDIYRLEGAGKVTADTRVTVHGKVQSAGGFGIHMTGAPTLEVERIEPV